MFRYLCNFLLQSLNALWFHTLKDGGWIDFPSKMLVYSHSFLSEGIDFPKSISFESLFYQPSLSLGSADVSFQTFLYHPPLNCFVAHFVSGEGTFLYLGKTLLYHPSVLSLPWFEVVSSLPSFFFVRGSISEYFLKTSSTIPSFWEMQIFPLSAFIAVSLNFLGYRLPDALAPSLINFHETLADNPVTPGYARRNFHKNRGNNPVTPGYARRNFHKNRGNNPVTPGYARRNFHKNRGNNPATPGYARRNFHENLGNDPVTPGYARRNFHENLVSPKSIQLF